MECQCAPYRAEGTTGPSPGLPFGSKAVFFLLIPRLLDTNSNAHILYNIAQYTTKSTCY